jgi:hypothetical protein
MSAERANHLGVSPFEILSIFTIRCKELLCKNPSVALFSLLMELYHGLTPTYSGNHKASLEGFLGGEY